MADNDRYLLPRQTNPPFTTSTCHVRPFQSRTSCVPSASFGVSAVGGFFWVGGDDAAIATIVGVPAYLNGYAALPLVSGLVERGMAPGAGLAFLVAGGVTSLSAAAAVGSNRECQASQSSLSRIGISSLCLL